MKIHDITGLPSDALRIARNYLSDLATPTLRLGVTGLARAGKTVFITSLVHSLMEGGRLPFLLPQAEGRLGRAWLEPQPDDDVPRFDYEGHVAALIGGEPRWPESTRAISQLRLTVPYDPPGLFARQLGRRELHIDIVDYPGEWLLDLGMMEQSYADWAAEQMSLARDAPRQGAAREWLALAASLDPAQAADEQVALAAARVFAAYLHKARGDDLSLSTVGPGRFLMPGDLAGSPLLTFVPLALPPGAAVQRGSLAAMMARRYESYKARVVKPFFRDHFARLDRQIVLVDVLAALGRGAGAIDDLTRALGRALAAFRPGARSGLAFLLPRRIDRIVFAATKADHLPRESHDALEAILGEIIADAAGRAVARGADIKVLAIAALRATEETLARQGRQDLACIKGVPLAGERIDGRVFDGRTPVAIFPGDLDRDPRRAIAAARKAGRPDDVCFLRFRPPVLASPSAIIEPQPWPHIRLDRALQHLIGDRLT